MGLQAFLSCFGCLYLRVFFIRRKLMVHPLCEKCRSAGKRRARLQPGTAIPGLQTWRKIWACFFFSLCLFWAVLLCLFCHSTCCIEKIF
ncbi:hypothetical protein METBIDRAFT_219222 [Metschnikowia bicuspidata var. bicuspidata NRRL YB-4993]|uniref:Uncharacterized protein n=1 Tax=Metschnikowia bicuspidata var. bicuspidata NRRL YB-4993 TaxID=869754 RepID=A0A1A0H598_9ASCO|nr:hypothetical protein METBIDRAFT_219222 [Metschnikowia bicuspidata var. bicuspidata NRRL YB-4993]OBA19125.1 hypothetical protein METBIDRAFT_219222 [Metschnikowia bicuspidata var. bicuspidata NRRL YB-4993]